MNIYSCSHPLKGFQIGLTENGKPDLFITSRNVDHIEKTKVGWLKCFDKFVSPNADRVIRNSTPIPCGKCIQCRLAYSREWAIRCIEEAKTAKYSYFVTLTYDDDHIPFNLKTIFDEGEIVSFPVYTLDKSELTKFFKDLRYAFWVKAGKPKKSVWSFDEDGTAHYRSVRDYDNCSFRYFACGEYGSETKTHRPHFHFLLFSDLELDLVEAPRDRRTSRSDSYKYFQSPLLESVWTDERKHLKGIVRVGECNYDTAAYVARYVVKKKKGKSASYYENENIVPEYTVMSRKPGIGYEYYALNKEHIYKYDQLLINKNKKGNVQTIRVHPAKYYDKLYDIEYPEYMAHLKDVRKNIAIEMNREIMSHTDLSPEEYDLMRERKLLDKMRCLERSIK